MKFSQLNFIISIYSPAAADSRCSATMSVTEGICFALAMSVDGFSAVWGRRFWIFRLPARYTESSIHYLQCQRALSGNMRRVSAKEITPGIGGALFVVLAFWQDYHRFIMTLCVKKSLRFHCGMV